MDKQLELDFPDPGRMSLDLGGHSDPPVEDQVPTAYPQKDQETAKVCIGNCNICRYCDNSDN